MDGGSRGHSRGRSHDSRGCQGLWPGVLGVMSSQSSHLGTVEAVPSAALGQVELGVDLCLVGGQLGLVLGKPRHLGCGHPHAGMGIGGGWGCRRRAGMAATISAAAAKSDSRSSAAALEGIDPPIVEAAEPGHLGLDRARVDAGLNAGLDPRGKERFGIGPVVGLLLGEGVELVDPGKTD